MKNKSLQIVFLLWLMSLAASAQTDSSFITILHTNDVHSRIDSFPVGYPKLGNRGGFARRATLIAGVKQKNPYTLVFDCGDMVQGTPYFNFFGGNLETELMDRMGYDAVTIGNHEFDNGMEALANRIRLAKFPFVCSNYDFSGTPLDGLTQPYVIFKRGGRTIGVIGLGIDPKGLIDPAKCKGLRYLDPVECANRYAALLKNDLGCDLVICLSHLGHSYDHDQTGDRQLARVTRNIDVILGGHTHTFLEAPVVEKNPDGQTVVISQSGWGGAMVGWVGLPR